MKIIFPIITAMLLTATAASAGDPAKAPAFMKETFPEQAVSAAFDEFHEIMLSPDAALDARSKELIALGVAAQVPCDYCVYYHEKAARTHGASDAQIREAIAAAALVRKWSTMLNGSQYDMDAWHDEVDAMFSSE